MRKLNVGAVIRAVGGVVSDIGLVSRATGFWFAALVVIALIAIALNVEPSFLDLVGPIALVACAVNVHRFILLKEAPDLARLSRHEWRYLWRTFGLAVLGILVFLLLRFTALAFWSGSIVDIMERFGLPSSVLRSLVFLFILPGMLALPAAAVGRLDFTVSKAWTASRGNFLRLALLVFVLVVLPMAIAYVLLDGFVSGMMVRGDETLARGIDMVVFLAIEVLMAVVWAALLSFAYKGLVEGDPEFAAATAAQSEQGTA